MTITIKDVANLILSFDIVYFCAQDSEDGESFCIMDYYMNSGRYTTGNKFRMTIFKDKVKIFYFPTLNITIQLQNETEFQELIGLYIDFKNRVEEYLTNVVKDMIKVKSNHKNPFDGYEAFINQVRENERAEQQRRREQRNPRPFAWAPMPDLDIPDPPMEDIEEH